MPITEKQRLDRRKHIGSSDVAIIAGQSPFKHTNISNLWHFKTGKADETIEVTEEMRLGQAMEPGVLNYYVDERNRNEDIPVKIRRNVARVYRQCYLKSHIDAVVCGQQLPVEAKTSGLNGPICGDWGKPGSDHVPVHVIFQAHAHMICMAPMTPEFCHVAALLGGRGFLLFEVPYNKDLADLIMNSCVTFWEKNVLRDIPPEGAIPSIDVLKKIKRIPEKRIIVDPSLVINYYNANRALQQAGKDRDQRYAELVTALGDAEEGICDGYTVTFFELTRNEKPRDARVSKYRKLVVKPIEPKECLPNE